MNKVLALHVHAALQDIQIEQLRVIIRALHQVSGRDLSSTPPGSFEAYSEVNLSSQASQRNPFFLNYYLRDQNAFLQYNIFS